jgi:hypothetical protein
MMRALVSLLFAAWFLAAPVRSEQPTEAEIRDTLGKLTEITGLKPRRAVQSAVMNRQELKAYLDHKIRTEVKPGEIHAEEVTLKLFGFVPPEFDLKSTTVELLAEQAAAFYDFQKKKLFLLSGGSELLQYPALVHELAHALADQHVNLGRFLKRAAQDDSQLARMAVMEGQAMWLMTEQSSRSLGFSLTKDPAAGDFYASQVAQMSAGQYPVFDKAPLYLRETLIFPYVAGMKFQNAVYHKRGRSSFLEVFRNAPVSTQQVLHPEAYFEHRQPLRLKPEGAPGKGYKELARGMVGELDMAILLEQYAGSGAARELPPHWRGSGYRVWESKAGGRPVLACAIAWDTEEAAAKFFSLYGKVQAGKWKKLGYSERTRERVTGESEGGRFEVRLSGRRVNILEGLP